MYNKLSELSEGVISMDIAAMSMEMSANQVKYETAMKLQKMVMDVQEQVVSDQLANMMKQLEELEALIPSELGQNVNMTI